MEAERWLSAVSFPTRPASPLSPRGQSILAQYPFPDLPMVPVPLSYLGLGTARLPQTLTGHLNCLVCTGKLCGLHQPLLSSLAVGVRNTNQISSLGREKFRVRNKEYSSGRNQIVIVGTKESRSKFSDRGSV